MQQNDIAQEMFSGQQPQQRQQRQVARKEPGFDMGMVSDSINEIGSRLRLLEERHSNMQRRNQVVEQNMVNTHKNLAAEIRTINSEISDIKRDIDDIKSKIRLIITDMKRFARQEDVKIIERYAEMWEPVNYVTPKEVERIVDEKLAEKMSH